MRYVSAVCDFQFPLNEIEVRTHSLLSPVPYLTIFLVAGPRSPFLSHIPPLSLRHSSLSPS